MIGDRIAALVDGPFCYSRALAPQVRRSLSARLGAEELPFVRGETVIAENEARPVVLGHPNYLGVFESSHHGPTVLLAGRWSALRPTAPYASVIVTEAIVDRTAAERALEGSRALRKRLRQIRGVSSVWKPQSPQLVMLLPNVPEPFPELDAIRSATLGYPELPGAVRIEVTDDVSAGDITRYAASLERAIIQEA